MNFKYFVESIIEKEHEGSLSTPSHVSVTLTALSEQLKGISGGLPWWCFITKNRLLGEAYRLDMFNKQYLEYHMAKMKLENKNIKF